MLPKWAAHHASHLFESWSCDMAMQSHESLGGKRNHICDGFCREDETCGRLLSVYMMGQARNKYLGRVDGFDNIPSRYRRRPY